MMRTTIDGVAGSCVLSVALVLMGALPLSAQARLPYGPVPVACDRACLDGTVPSITLTNGQTVNMANFNRPASTHSVPYHLNSPWQGGLSGKQAWNQV